MSNVKGFDDKVASLDVTLCVHVRCVSSWEMGKKKKSVGFFDRYWRNWGSFIGVDETWCEAFGRIISGLGC